MKHNLFTTAAAIALIAFIGMSGGCISMDKPGPPAESVILHPAGAKLQGMKAEDLIIKANKTKAETIFHTQQIRQIAEHYKHAIVSIYTKTKTSYSIRLFPKIGPGVKVRLPGMGLGSGFFIHPDGYILHFA